MPFVFFNKQIIADKLKNYDYYVIHLILKKLYNIHTIFFIYSRNPKEKEEVEMEAKLSKYRGLY